MTKMELFINPGAEPASAPPRERLNTHDGLQGSQESSRAARGLTPAAAAPPPPLAVSCVCGVL